ncbi:hypothetical protein [Thermoleptolyngbya sp. C42_A2020_037]|uniref:hypothetical protein n=1 Tax=Thermoleptolyngbya sp. C42_A2020_037 TaxID=2747799 RepID=UPI0019E073A7|nr:hypothetical protein [Thermoleptolyngbya sp. C42_A2020_037]MBF2083375.1 hypothetical protein [Thermoleptolyngbya sp. C42_A2020_037]
MADFVCQIPVPQTQQELDQAVQTYLDANLSGLDLFCHWQAIREAAIAQSGSTSPAESDKTGAIAGEDSY